MLTRWNDWGRGRWGGQSFDDLESVVEGLNELRREMNRWSSDYDQQFGETPPRQSLPTYWPRMALSDTGEALVLRAELPGFGEDDLEISVHDTTLVITGERKIEAREGYDVHRRERGALKFSRSATLPSRVDADKAEAHLERGVLELILPKVPDALPKHIAVQGG